VSDDRLDPSAALRDPRWLGALALLALNDHVLKQSAWSGVVTGKLSDLAGLVVAPVLLAVLFRVRSRRGLMLTTVAIGLVFTALQLSRTFADAWSALMGAVGISWGTVCDPTDLLALPMLGMAVALVLRPRAIAIPAWRNAVEGTAVVTAVVVCAATSQEPDRNRVELRDESTFELDMDTPMVEFEINACSTEPGLWVEVSGEVEISPGAVVGLTVQQLEETRTGFADDAVEGLWASATLDGVECGSPLFVTFERLDGALEGTVSVTMWLEADADGDEGTTSLAVR
jgi:hypothetical protein